LSVAQIVGHFAIEFCCDPQLRFARRLGLRNRLRLGSPAAAYAPHNSSAQPRQIGRNTFDRDRCSSRHARWKPANASLVEDQPLNGRKLRLAVGENANRPAEARGLSLDISGKQELDHRAPLCRRQARVDSTNCSRDSSHGCADDRVVNVRLPKNRSAQQFL
jgi:hypothetical protein